MDQNRDNDGGDITRPEGAADGRVAVPDTPPHGYVPPELQPQGINYTAGGEPTRQLGAPPPPQGAVPPAYVPRPSTYVGGPQPDSERRPHRVPIIGPVLLIGAGLLFLLDNLGVISFNVWELWRLWPLVLIAIGLDLIVGRRSPVLSLLLVIAVLAGGAALLYGSGGLRSRGDTMRTNLSVPLEGAKSADVYIESGTGRLSVHTGDTSRLAVGTLEYYETMGIPAQTVERAGDKVTLRLSQPGDERNSFGDEGPEWNISLNPQVPTRLTVNTGVGETDLDLKDARVTELNMEVGVGATNVTLPEQGGTTQVNIRGGVGALNLSIPDEVEARIKVQSGLGGVDVDDRFRAEGEDTYVSQGYDRAENKVEVQVQVGVGGIEVDSR